VSFAFGVKALQPIAGQPHILGFAAAETTSDQTIVEVWNGPSSAARVLRINKDGQIQAANGAVGTPAYSFESDKDSGMYRIGANEIGLAVGGAARVTVSASLVSIVGSSADEQLRINHASATGNPFIGFYQNGTRRAYIQSGDSGDYLGLLAEYGPVYLGSGNDWRVAVSTTAFYPFADDGITLGTGTYKFSDLFLASGGVINFNNGNATITHSAGNLKFSSDVELDGALNHDGTTVGFYGTAPIAQQAGVPVTAAGVHAACVALGLFTA